MTLLPKGVEHVMISSVAQTGLEELKDKLWSKLRPVEVIKADPWS